MNIYRDNFDELHTFDSYFKVQKKSRKEFVIAYINIGVSEHPVNPLKEIKFIDKAYIVAKDINFLRIGNNIEMDFINKSSEIYYLGGFDMDIKEHVEMQISASDIYLELIKTSQVRDRMWVPIKTPNYKRNMDEVDVDIFLNTNIVHNN